MDQPGVQQAQPLPQRLFPANDQATVTVFCSVVACFVALGYCLLRLGTVDMGWSAAFQVAGLSLFLLHVPLLRSLFDRGARASPAAWYLSEAALAVGGLAVVVGAGWLGDRYPLGYLFACAGALLFLANLFTWVRAGRFLLSAALIVVACVIAIWVAGTVWATPYHHPLIVEALSRKDQINGDAVFHAAIAKMFKTHSIPSSGLDGVPYFRYHYGSHLVVAQLSSLLRLDVLDFYQSAFPVLFVPFFFRSLLHCALVLRRVMSSGGGRGDTGIPPLRADGWFWIVLLAALIGFLPTTILQHAGVNTPNPFLSVSHNLATSLSLLLVALMIPVCLSVRDRLDRLTTSEISLFLIVLPGWLIAIGLCKISLMFLLLGLGCWFFWRCRGFRSVVFCLGLALAFAGSCTTFLAVREPSGTQIRFLGYLRDTIAWDWRSLHLLLLWFWPLLYLVVRLRMTGVATLAELWDAFVGRKLLDVELLLVLALLGFAPGTALYLYSNEEYFTDGQRWVGLAFVLGISAPFLAEVRLRMQTARSWRQVPLGFCAVVFLLGAVSPILFFRWVERVEELAEKSLAYRGAEPHLVAVLQHLPCLHKGRLAWKVWNQREDLRRIAASRHFREDPTCRLLAALHELEHLPLAEKKRTALFIPRTNRVYWDLISNPGQACLAVALSGIAMIDGLPAANPDAPWHYGHHFYDRAGKEPFAQDDTEAILRRARSLGFSRVLVIQSDPTTGTPNTWSLGAEDLLARKGAAR
jgi:hypothetical protein